MNLTIVILSYNSENTLEQCLKSIKDSKPDHDCEVVVFDDGSSDDSPFIAKKYADRVIELKHQGRSEARVEAFNRVKGGIIVNIDSDVVIKKNSFKKILSYFRKHPSVAALTGILAKEHPHKNFSSQYKNLYMHYHFSMLPQKVNFLYGSIYAIRKEFIQKRRSSVNVADDTQLGQSIIKRGGEIFLLKNLQVIHLKKYDLKSILKNDFRIPFDWAQIFWKYQGWKQLGKNEVGFAHASMAQLISLLIAPLIISILALTIIVPVLPFFIIVIIFWVLLNIGFHEFLYKEKGFWFVLRAIVFTFFDNLVMFGGILAGSVYYLWKYRIIN